MHWILSWQLFLQAEAHIIHGYLYLTDRGGTEDKNDSLVLSFDFLLLTMQFGKLAKSNPLSSESDSSSDSSSESSTESS